MTPLMNSIIHENSCTFVRSPSALYPVLCSVPGTPTTPVLSVTPKTLVVDTDTQYAEHFQCEAMVGYPAPGSTVLQTNKNGNFETFALGTSELSSISEDCSITETLTIKAVTFDASWNNTQLRCSLEDNEGQSTGVVSEDYTIRLLPGKKISKVNLSFNFIFANILLLIKSNF